MKKRITIVSILCFAFFICSFLYGCIKPVNVNAYAELSNAFSKASDSSDATVEIIVKAGEELVYFEKTNYLVTESGVEYTETVKKPSADVWEKDELIETDSSGKIEKADYSRVLLADVTIEDTDVDGKVIRTENENSIIYEFTLRNAKKILGENANGVSNVKVKIQTKEGKVVSVDASYEYDGYAIQKKYEMNY